MCGVVCRAMCWYLCFCSVDVVIAAVIRRLLSSVDTGRNITVMTLFIQSSVRTFSHSIQISPLSQNIIATASVSTPDKYTQTVSTIIVYTRSSHYTTLSSDYVLVSSYLSICYILPIVGFDTISKSYA